ncbi:MAG TPA: nitroreductase family protein [Opitutaceae bacterium]
MELLEAISHHGIVRDYSPQEVPRTVLHELLRAAAQAPCVTNRQPIVFCVYQGRKRLRNYSDRIKAHLLATRAPSFELCGPDEMLADPAYNAFYNASTLLVICAKSTTFDPAEDCCLAAENLMLAAHAHGLGTCPIAFARPWLTLPETKQELEIPLDLTPIFSLVIGYPAKPVVEPSPNEQEPEIAVWKSGD